MMADEKLSDIRLPYARAFAAQGEAKGKIKGEADALLLVLASRNFEVSEEIRRKILACTDIEQLQTWLWRAARAEKIAEVFG